MVLITFNDLPSPQILLFSVLHFVPTAIDRTVLRLRPARTTLNMSTSVPAVRTPKAPTSAHLPEPLAPQVLLNLQILGAASRASSCPKRFGPATHLAPSPRDHLALPTLNPPSRGRTTLSAARLTPEAARPLTRPRLGLSAWRPPLPHCPSRAYAEEQGSTSPGPGTYSGR